MPLRALQALSKVSDDTPGPIRRPQNCLNHAGGHVSGPSPKVSRPEPFLRSVTAVAKNLAFDKTIEKAQGLSANVAMADGDAKFQLSPAQLRDVRHIWFEHLTSSEDFVLPGQEKNERWFVGSDAFDKTCVYGAPSRTRVVP